MRRDPLQVLYLHKNKLGGSLPAAWAGMAALEDLTLNENQLTGETLMLLVRSEHAAVMVVFASACQAFVHAWVDCWY
jgi:hypothetical protein